MSREDALVRNQAQPLAQAERWPIVAPACDVYENNDEILVVADMPGVTADSLTINMDKGELSIVAPRDVSPQEGTLLGLEYRACEYRRRFAVPGGVDAAKINAELKDGVLWLHLPKSEALKPRQIAVRAG